MSFRQIRIGSEFRSRDETMKKRIAAWLAVLLLTVCLSACTGGDSSESTLRDSGIKTDATGAEVKTPSASASPKTESNRSTDNETAAPNPADGSDWGPFA